MTTKQMIEKEIEKIDNGLEYTGIFPDRLRQSMIRVVEAALGDLGIKNDGYRGSLFGEGYNKALDDIENRIQSIINSIKE